MKANLVLFIAIAQILSVTPLSAEWNIQKPSKEVPAKISGEIFGKKFNLGKAEWSKHGLTISSKEKMGGWPESELFIFIKEDSGKTQWLVTPDKSGFDSPHVHMKFGKKGAKFPGTLMFVSEYSMYLELMEKKTDIATFKIHVSLPDYKKSFLFGTFEAKIKG